MSTLLVASLYNLGTDRIHNAVSKNLVYFYALSHCRGCVFIELLPSNGCLYQSSCHHIINETEQNIETMDINHVT
jgi:pyrroloquinoline quinone (PQQ) biosynthesis protein C